MTEFIKADMSHREEFIDFLNYVYSYASCPHDFKAMVPKIYADDAEFLACNHYLAVEDGKIKGVVSSRYIEVKVGGELLKYSLIGNVAVHPYARGRNYMKTLMKIAIKEAKSDGIDIIVLGGKRQRYGYFGFEHAGVKYQFKVTRTNVRHAMKQVECDDITFEVINNPDAEELDIAKKLYENRPVHCIRPRKELLHIMNSWEADIYAVKRKGRMIGYVYEYANLGELVLETESDLAPVLKAWLLQDGKNEVTIYAYPYEKERIAYLTDICEYMSLAVVKMVHVLDWEKVLRIMLKFQNEIHPLSDGEAEFCIEEEAFRIQISSGTVEAEKICTDVCCEKIKDIPKFTQNQAEQLFFGMQNLLNPKAEYKNWLPLPFFIDLPDTF